jgi:AraC family transcriptional regulator
MKYFELQLQNSKLMLVQFAPHTADPKLHGHGDDFQISIPLDGAPHIQFNGETRQLFARQWCITGPGDRHMHFSNEQASRLLLINFRRDFLHELIQEWLGESTNQVEFAPWADGPTDSVKKIADQLIQKSIDHPSDSVELRELEWTIDLLARESGLSKFHMIRLFREHVGFTPAQYLTEVRLQRATELLGQTEQDVTDIAFEVGFGSLATFERLFKKKFGTTPSQYRKFKSD